MNEVFPRSLAPHPYSVRLYRQRVPSQRFIEDIAEQMEEPLVVNENDEIIDGVRRWLAALELGKVSIEAVEKSYPSVEAEKKAILRHNDDRDETFSQRIRVALEYDRLVSPVLEERMKTGKSLEEQEKDPLLKSKEGETALELAADRVGWGQTKYWQAKTVWKAKESGDNYAMKLVTRLDAGDISVNKAYEELNDREDETLQDEDYIRRGLSKEDDFAEEKMQTYGPVQASFQTDSRQFKLLLSKSSPLRKMERQKEDRKEFPDLYLEVSENEVRTHTSEQLHTVRSQHVFSDHYFEDVSLESDTSIGILIPSGLVDGMLGMVNDEIRIELRGSEDSSLAEGFVMTDGSLYTWIAAPNHHEDALEAINPDSRENA